MLRLGGSAALYLCRCYPHCCLYGLMQQTTGELIIVDHCRSIHIASETPLDRWCVSSFPISYILWLGSSALSEPAL